MGLRSVNEHELRRRYPFASEAFIKKNCADSASSSPESQRPVRNDALGQAPRKEGYLGRSKVRITSFRRRLLDPDNLIGGTKYFTDCLRYSGLISGDAEAQIRLEVSQQKVATKAEEHTLIEIEPIELIVTALSTQPASVPAESFSPTESISRMTRPHLIERFWDTCSKTWNRQAFNAFMETLSDEDLKYYVQMGGP